MAGAMGLGGGSIDVLVRFVGDASDLKKKVDDVEGSGKKTAKVFGAIGGAVAGAFAIKAVTDFTSAASDMNETMSKNTVVFKDQAKWVAEWGKTSAENMGLSSQQAIEAAGTFGNLFTAMGIGTRQAAVTSKSIVQLAADLGSFNNVPTEDALAALKSGLVGETEPLRAFGVNINDARLKAEALRMGLVQAPVDMQKVQIATESLALANEKAAKASKEHGAQSEEARRANLAVEKAQGSLNDALAGGNVELDAATKAQAAYSLIMQDTKTAQGDFARTSDGLANSTKTMNAKWKDTQAQLGQALLPIMEKVTKFVSDTLVPAINKLSESGLIPWILGAAAALWVLNAALAANPVVLIVAGVLLLIAAVALLWANWDKVWTWIMDHKAYAALIAWFLPIVAGIVILVGIVKWLWENWDTIWNGIKDVVGVVVGWIIDRWHSIQPVISGVVSFVRQWIDALIQIFNGIKDAVGKVFDWWKEGWDKFAGVIEGVVGAVSRAVGKVVNAIKGPINAVLGAWNDLKLTVPAVNVGPLHIGGQTIDFPNVPTLAKGGFVMRTGLAVVHEGETFSGVGNQLGGDVINITVNVAPATDPAQTGRTIVEYLTAYERANGRQVMVR